MRVALGLTGGLMVILGLAMILVGVMSMGDGAAVLLLGCALLAVGIVMIVRAARGRQQSA